MTKLFQFVYLLINAINHLLLSKRLSSHQVITRNYLFCIFLYLNNCSQIKKKCKNRISILSQIEKPDQSLLIQ